MSGLSSKTFSCGGEGDLLRGGGEGSLTTAGFFPLASLGKKFKMPPFFVSASASASDSMSEGTGDSDDSEDNSEESSSAILCGFFPVALVAAVCSVESWMGWVSWKVEV